MFRPDVLHTAGEGGPSRPGESAWSAGDLFPLAPGAPDSVRLAQVLAEFEAASDPWLEEFIESGWVGPTPDEELEAAAEKDEHQEPVDLAVLAQHPGARVPARMPSVEGMPGGVELAAALAAADVTSLGAYELVEFIAGCERVAAAMHALQATAVAELARRVEMRPVDGARVSVSPQRVTALEVSARLAVSGAEGEALVARAEYLQQVLPDTFAAWAAGRIDTRKAETIARTLYRHDPRLARMVEARVLPRAEELTVESLRRLINREIHRLDPKDAQARHQDARQRRHIVITPVGDGMSWIEAYVPDEVAAAVKATLDAGAASLKQKYPDDGRTMGARRVDVLAALAVAALSAGRVGGCAACGGGIKLADAQHRPVTVNVTVPASSLLGVDDQPGELAGFGPISADAARRLADGGVWRRILTDPASGTVLDVGRTQYRPPAPLAEHIMVRDVRCVWPGCDRPARSPGVDIDHILDWALGGVTADHNLGLLCEKHHVDKHNSKWQVRQPEPGRFVYTSPTGHRYTREPERVGQLGLADAPERMGQLGVASAPDRVGQFASDPDPPAPF